MTMCLPKYVAIAALIYGSVAVAAAETLPDGVARCRAIAADGARLACFDALAIQAASAPGGSSRITSGAGSTARFGMPPRRAPALSAEMEALESTVAKVAPSGRDRVTVTLADGSVWRTTEGSRFQPRTGENVRIRRAALGSYLARFGQGRGLRIERLR